MFLRCSLRAVGCAATTHRSSALYCTGGCKNGARSNLIFGMQPLLNSCLCVYVCAHTCVFGWVIYHAIIAYPIQSHSYYKLDLFFKWNERTMSRQSGLCILWCVINALSCHRSKWSLQYKLQQYLPRAAAAGPDEAWFYISLLLLASDFVLSLTATDDPSCYQLVGARKTKGGDRSRNKTRISVYKRDVKEWKWQCSLRFQAFQNAPPDFRCW